MPKSARPSERRAKAAALRGTVGSNQLILHAVESVRCQMERIMYAATDIRYHGELPVDEHCEIVEAIVKRESVRVRQLMYDHIVGSRAKVIDMAGGGAHR